MINDFNSIVTVLSNLRCAQVFGVSSRDLTLRWHTYFLLLSLAHWICKTFLMSLSYCFEMDTYIYGFECAKDKFEKYVAIISF